MNRSVFYKLIIIFCVAISILLIATACDGASGGNGTTAAPETTAEETTTDAGDETTAAPETTTADDTTVLDTKNTYTVTVVDADGAPLAGATVQLCVGDICRLPVATDANGVAIIEADAGDYAVKVTLSGYTGEAQYSFPEGSTELTVTLTANS